MRAIAYWIVINTDVVEWDRCRWIVRILIGHAAAHVAATEQ